MITQKQIKQWFKDNNINPKHDFKKLKFAFNSLTGEISNPDIDAEDVMDFIFLNRPIRAIHTHSHGFHTSTGRALIDLFTHYYHSADEECLS